MNIMSENIKKHDNANIKCLLTWYLNFKGRLKKLQYFG